MTPQELATERHDGQTRKGPNPVPYVTHCAEVAATVARHGGTTGAIEAAWLHDTVEDTETTLAEIERLFGAAVAGFVDEVTDDTSLPKAERQAAQISSAPHKSAGAALIKAADQMSNMNSLVSSPPEWPAERRLAYINKARAVVAGLNIPDELRNEFTAAALEAEAFDTAD